MRAMTSVVSFMALTLNFAGPLLAQDQKASDRSDKSLKQWIEALTTSEHVDLVNQARAALGPDGTFGKAAVPALIEAFNPKISPEIAAAIGDRSWRVAETLADHGPAIVPSLLQALTRPEAQVRRGAARTLGEIRPRAHEVIPAITKASQDPVPEVRAAAVYSLGVIARERAIDALISSLRDNNDQVREAAATALRELGRKAKPATSALTRALKDKSRNVREDAAFTLGGVGRDAKTAVPGLIAALRSGENERSHWIIAQTLGRIGPDAREAVPVLMEALQAKDDSLRQWATIALGEIGPSAKAAVPQLIAAAKNDDNEDCEAAITALGGIGPDAREAVPMLLRELGRKQRYGHTRALVADALGGIGPAAKEAVPALAALARNPVDENGSAYPPGRRAAAEAVMKIDPEYGAKHHIEFSCLDVRLGKLPAIKLVPRPAMTDEKKRRIKQLIADLVGLSEPDYGLSSTLTGHAFAPLPGHTRFGAGLVTDHELKASESLRKLVEAGSDALPFLLEALGDTRPTKLKVNARGTPFFAHELERNVLNSIERRVLSQKWDKNDDDNDDGPSDPRAYTLRIGDACFVALGQIVGRSYSAVRYQPSMMVVINSPVESKIMRERLWAIWKSEDPTRKLLDSLLLDYATEGIFNGRSLDGWAEGSDRQIEAAMRLLYYFPDESAPIIAGRLRSFDVQDARDTGWMKREVKNGVRTSEFIEAVSWCKSPTIKEALGDIARRTNDPQIRKAIESGRATDR